MSRIAKHKWREGVHTSEQRVQGAENVGEHKTSMLQDLEAGNPFEIEALIGAILEIGRLTNTPAPAIEAVYALFKLLDNSTQAAGGVLRAGWAAAVRAT